MIIITREQFIAYRSAYFYLNSLKESIPVLLEASLNNILNYIAHELSNYDLKAYAKNLLKFKPEDLSLKDLQKKTIFVVRTLQVIPTPVTKDSIALEKYLKTLIIDEKLKERGMRK